MSTFHFEGIVFWKLFHVDAILGPTVIVDPYHVPLIATDLNRIVRATFPAFQREVRDSFDDLIPAGRDGLSFMIGM